MKVLDMICFVLVVIGGINWGIVGLTGGRLDLVRDTAGMITPYLAYTVYLLVGIAAVVEIFLWKPSHLRLYLHEKKGGPLPTL